MNLENGEANLSYTGELCVEDPSSYYSNYAAAEENEIGLGYLEENNINVVNYDLEDEMRRMQQHLEMEMESSCNLNLVNLLSMSSSSSTTCSGWGWGLGSASGSGVVYEPVQQLHLNLTPQQTQGYCGGREPVRQPKNFVTERQRRQTFNDKFVHLRSLLPNPNKNDRASIVGDAIEYIKELTRTVKELSILVDKKKRSSSTNRNNKRHKPSTTTTDQDGDTITNDKNEQDESLRSSWLQRRCKDTDIDVRIVHDDVTVKLVQRKTVFNLLLYVSRTFDDLKLDLHHVTGGNVGDYCTFLFNTKISQGSSLYASAIADRLIQVLQRQYAAFH